MLPVCLSFRPKNAQLLDPWLIEQRVVGLNFFSLLEANNLTAH